MNSSLTITAKFFKGFADATRLSILLSLVNESKTVNEIVEATGLNQPNVSNHLKCLVGCGIVLGHRDGKNIVYSIRDEQTKQLLDISQKIIEPVSCDIECCLENDRLDQQKGAAHDR